MPLGKRLPFILDVIPGTFEKLDLLLHSVCEGLNGCQGVCPPSHRDHECMAISALNLLKLQVEYTDICVLSYSIIYIFSILCFFQCMQLYSVITEDIPPADLGLTPGSPLLTSLKQCVVELARSVNMLPSVQLAAQDVLRTGWGVLLPTVSERASALSQLLPSGEGLLIIIL